MGNCDFIIGEVLYKIGLQSWFYSVQLISSKERYLLSCSGDLSNSKFQNNFHTISVKLFKRVTILFASLGNTKAVLKSKCLHQKIHFKQLIPNLSEFFTLKVSKNYSL